MEERENDLITSTINKSEEELEENLRPTTLEQYVGQNKIKNKLKIFIKAAKMRKEQLDHVLLYGPPGLGKTTLASIISKEMNVNIRITSGPAIERPGDLAAILTNLNENDVLFIDEIHRLNRSVEEILYPAMEDFALDIIIGKGPSARSVRLDLSKFTLIGATTRSGALSSPLRDRFGVICKLDYYSENELTSIVKRSANILKIHINQEGAEELSKRSRGTPRISNRILKRVRDYAMVKGKGNIDKTIAEAALEILEIDYSGLDSVDIKILKTIIDFYKGGPVGLDTLAASIGEESITIEDVYEPYLMQKGFLSRTPRGRIVTEKTYQYLNIQSNEEQVRFNGNRS